MALRAADALIATHNQTRAAFYRNLLLELGYDVHVARDGDEAQQILAKHGAPRLVLADVSLPKTDGISLVRHLRRDNPADRLGAIVVSAHEPLRAMARQLADSLGIVRVLPVDADRTMLREAIQAAVQTAPPAVGMPREPLSAMAAGGGGERLEDALDHVAVEGVHRYRVALCMAYVKAAGQEHLAAHFAASEALGGNFELPSTALLRQVAAGEEPLILPDVENSPLGREFSVGKSGLVRGFAGVPVVFEHGSAAGALCLLDTRPLILNAADVDNLTTFARELGRQVERRLDLSAPPGVLNGPRTDRLSEDLKTLEQLAVTDPLTGLSNRRGGEQNIASEISRARRQKSSLSCILLDIDRFKDVNDTYGHQAGDRVLREISALLRRTLRAYDILIRWGGEEFLIVLPGVGLDLARRLAERIRQAVETLETQGIGPITVSAGAATLDTDYDFDGMLSQADRRLYQAKAAGRNCIA